VTSSNEKENEKRRKRYAEDPEYRETELARKRAHYQLQRDAINAGLRHRYATDPEFRLKRKKDPVKARAAELSRSFYRRPLASRSRATLSRMVRRKSSWERSKRSIPATGLHLMMIWRRPIVPLSCLRSNVRRYSNRTCRRRARTCGSGLATRAGPKK
jgi:hypothetical protein